MPVVLPLRTTAISALPFPSPKVPFAALNCTCDAGVPTGSQSGNQSTSVLLVSFARLLPFASITNSSTVVSSLTLPEAKTMFEPSNDQAAKQQVSLLVV